MTSRNWMAWVVVALVTAVGISNGWRVSGTGGAIHYPDLQVQVPLDSFSIVRPHRRPASFVTPTYSRMSATGRSSYGWRMIQRQIDRGVFRGYCTQRVEQLDPRQRDLNGRAL